MKNFFIVTSCINVSFGIFDGNERFNQTIESFKSIRKNVEDPFILFIDSSTIPLTLEQKSKIVDHVDDYLDFSENVQAQLINNQPNPHVLKSFGELYLLLNGILHLKNTINFNSIEGRMFKLGGRCKLNSGFNINDYEGFKGKYIFKKRIPSWLSKEVQEYLGCTHLLETRLYSWCLTLVDDYINVINKNFELLHKGLDTEHSHFVNIDKNNLIEFDKMFCDCSIAASGQIMND